MNKIAQGLVGIVGATGIFFAGVLVGKFNANTHWESYLLNKGYGEYDRKTGKWQLCEPEVVLLNRNTEAIRLLNGGTLTINDYLKIIEGDLKEAKDRIASQTKELTEQDILIEKYKKSVKLPPDTNKSSTKKPLESFDPSVIIPVK